MPEDFDLKSPQNSQLITVRLCNMIIYGYHGALPEENALGQRFEIDLEYQFLGEAAVSTDQLKQTISYVDVYQILCEAVTHHQFKLLETLGYRIMQNIHKRFPAIQNLTIRIRKPSVPIPGVLDHVEVELQWNSPTKLS